MNVCVVIALACNVSPTLGVRTHRTIAIKDCATSCPYNIMSDCMALASGWSNWNSLSMSCLNSQQLECESFGQSINYVETVHA